jgi:ribonuclease III
MQPSLLQRLTQSLGYQFKNIPLLQQALTHRSCPGVHNERLEFLGDAVLGAVIASALFKRHPNASEGMLSAMRSTLVCEQTLVILAQTLQLGDSISVGASELGQVQTRPSLLADTLEALIGAIYLEAGWEHCEACVLNWYQPYLNQVQYVAPIKDAKTALQEHLQARGQQLPCYKLVDKTGKSHEPVFTIQCRLPDPSSIPSTHGVGNNRRAAEQHAAAKLLAFLQQQDDEQSVSEQHNHAVDRN